MRYLKNKHKNWQNATEVIKYNVENLEQDDGWMAKRMSDKKEQQRQYHQDWHNDRHGNIRNRRSSRNTNNKKCKNRSQRIDRRKYIEVKKTARKLEECEVYNKTSKNTVSEE